jgi:hypothetical protein
MRQRGKKNGTACHDTDVNITRRVRFACWITEAIHISLEYLIPLEVRQLKAA